MVLDLKINWIFFNCNYFHRFLIYDLPMKNKTNKNYKKLLKEKDLILL